MQHDRRAIPAGAAYLVRYAFTLVQIVQGGKVSRPNDETPSVQGKGFQETNQKTDSAIVALAEKLGNCDKPNLIARLARAGHVVHECSEQSFTVVNPRWGMSRYCPDLAALVAFARIVGVKQ